MGLGDVAKTQAARRAATKKPSRMYTDEDLEDIGQENDIDSSKPQFIPGKKKGEYTFTNKDLGDEAQEAREKNWDDTVYHSKAPRAHNRKRGGRFTTKQAGDALAME
jgi:hypothetical protein